MRIQDVDPFIYLIEGTIWGGLDIEEDITDKPLLFGGRWVSELRSGIPVEPAKRRRKER